LVVAEPAAGGGGKGAGREVGEREEGGREEGGRDVGEKEDGGRKEDGDGDGCSACV
jgi:hypothetical protein